MKMQYDRWIDYTVAHENIRRVLSCVPPKVVADFLFVTEQTVKAWQCGKSFPACSHLIALSVIAGQNLADFLGLNVPKTLPESIPQMLETETTKPPTEHPVPTEFLYEDKNDLLQKLALDFYLNNSYFETLREFILYLPLFDDGNLRDFLYRTTGDISHSYLFEKTRDLYKSIPETPEKHYANQIRYFHMVSPVVCNIPADTTLSHERAKLHEFQKYISSDMHSKDEAAYLDKLLEFRRKLYL